ncbi:hypothetical protein SAMN05444394_3019 [Algoriphagus halophilus]|uniref:Uncharacterized protein n=1 Tax=Algoriphagus halophilus TaxID=226505 RepID=A0A1N6G777_9BACT|nr:hypothetical protein SAMN05444394_3019 [Algoriphagus halophilus]
MIKISKNLNIPTFRLLLQYLLLNYLYLINYFLKQRQLLPILFLVRN